MDTPITVSSGSTVLNKTDFLQLNYSSGKNKESIISLDTTSSERVPVSWDTKTTTFARTESNTSLTHIQKVSSWMRSIDVDPKSGSTVVDVENNIPDAKSLDSGETIDISNNDDDPNSKSVILYRCDFNKSVSAKTYYPPPNPFNRTMPLLDYFKNENANKLMGNISKNLEHVSAKSNLNHTSKKVIKKRLLLRRADPGKLINYPSQINNKFSIENESYNFKISDEKSDGSSDTYEQGYEVTPEVPMSPESRKKELCSYLQLMNPADKKERLILQNRRSTRVRNLAAMQEKKKMERKIRESEMEEPELIENEVEKCPTLKSFKELNIKIEKINKPMLQDLVQEKVNDEGFEKDSFYFPFPSKDLTEIVDYFDDTMSKLLPRFKRICKIKNLKVNCTRKLMKRAPTKRNNIIKNNKGIPKQKLVAESIENKRICDTKNATTSKCHKLKDLLKAKFKKPTTDRSNSLRSTNNLKNVSLKKLIGRKEMELIKNKKRLRRKQLRERQQIEKAKQTKPAKKFSVTSSRRNSKVISSNSQCEIVTVPESKEDLANFMDDIDFKNLSEEHKKCLIESRILSTKPIPQVAPTHSVPQASKPFYSIEAMTPLYGFNKKDVNEVKKICESYKTSVLKNSKDMQDYFFGVDDVKIEDSEVMADIEYKTDINTFESRIEKLACPIINPNLEPKFLDICDNQCEIDNTLEELEEKASVNREVLTNGVPLQEHDYAGLPDAADDEDTEVDVVTVPNKNLPVEGYIEINPRSIEKKSKFELLPYNKSIEMKSLHRSLQYIKRKPQDALAVHNFTQEWDSETSPKQKTRKQSHSISINKESGAVLKAFYIDYTLIVCQEYVVSFWMQTPLGNVLGSQNMWFPRGQTQRLVLNSKCIQKESMEMVISMENHIAYIELWTKEHKSDIRQGPVADVFATVYFWKQRQNGLDKKVLQLENINGFADDVQYSVMKCSPKIIVSWHSANEDSLTKRTFIHAYQLAPDYQTVSNIYDIEPVDHYVSSLHNIEDCDNLIMGCGENKITLWNVEYGYIIATIELSKIKSPLSTLWVKCDRGFLFALQQCVDRELRLIAINGINHSWKKLASYNPPEGFDRLRGVCIENGLLLSFYDQGILCWKAETGEPVEETSIETEIIPSGKYVIILEDNQILVKHAITHLMSTSIDET